MSLRSSMCPQLHFLTCPMVLLVWHNRAVGSSCLGEFHQKDWQKYFLFHQWTYLKYWWIYKACFIAWKGSEDPFSGSYWELHRWKSCWQVSLITKEKIYRVFQKSYFSFCQDLIPKGKISEQDNSMKITGKLSREIWDLRLVHIRSSRGREYQWTRRTFLFLWLCLLTCFQIALGRFQPA